VRLLPALLLMLLPGAALAQAVDCDNAMVQVEMTFCAEKAWMLADEDLNLAYGLARKAMKNLDANLPADQRGAEAALRDAQRAWINFRDAACTAEGYQMHGGSAEPMVVYGCRERLTRSRAEDLRLLGEPW
jgi:uncharacterized protein YecT (DUF1311 family)